MKVRIFVEPQQGADYQQLLAVAQQAEACGFDAFFRSDHYLTMGGDGLPGPTDAWVTLAGLARETSRIRLGTLVSSSTFRWPGILAVTVAQVDAMSGGRIELGLGTGWYEGEHTAYGIPFPPLGERFERLEEQLSIITGLWDTPAGGTYSYAGQHYQLVESPALPKPVQRPHPPVIVGGGGATRTPRLAATFADEFNLAFHGVAETEAQFVRVRAACEQVREQAARSGLPAEATVEWHHRPTQTLDPETGQGNAHVQFAFAAHRAVVDVDTELGLVKVVEIATAQDVGKAMNPQAVEGQIHGGIAQGLGLAVMEEIQVTDGVVRNPSFTDYLIPTILDMPPVRLDVLELADPHAPYGLRGIGEPPTISSTPAVVAAIRAATGLDLTRVPVRPEHITRT